MPPAEGLEKAAAAFQERKRKEEEAELAARGEIEAKEKAKQDQLKREAEEKKQLTRKIAKVVGKITDTSSFVKGLELRIQPERVKNATRMLKASRFELYNDVKDTYTSGVVKSQTDPDLVYACRISDDGSYSCCTQNLRACGGLRGSPCKHLMVLIIGLVNAGQLDGAKIDQWLAKTQHVEPVLDRDVMAEVFLRYHGAEAGEIDWRPTETLPEDYYSL